LGTIEGLAEDAILTASIDLRKTAAIPRFSKSIPDFGRRTPDLLRSARKLSKREGTKLGTVHSRDRHNCKKSLISLVGGAGFEPATPGL